MPRAEGVAHADRAGAEGRALVEGFARDAQAVLDELGAHVVGLREVRQAVLTALLAGGHVLLEGAPGLGKTLLVRTLGHALELSFARVQFTPDLMPPDIIGASVLLEGARSFEFQAGPVFTNLLLADEINRGTPRTQSALLEAMQEGSVTVAGKTRPLPEPFFVLATQNPIEMEGTYPLPEAELDRFMIKVELGAPSGDELHDILDRTVGGVAAAARPVLGRARVLEMQALVRAVPIARSVQDYAVRLVQATHPDRSTLSGVRRHVRNGSSPRGAQALVLTAKARALAQGRATPDVDDVRACAQAALAHRLILKLEAEADGVTGQAVVAEVVAEVPSGL